MSKQAQTFIGLTIGLGVCLLAYCLAGALGAVPSSGFLAVFLLSMAASTMKVRLPGITGTISVNFLFILVAIAIFTFSETVLLASVACVVQCMWRPKKQPRLVQVAFNVSVLAISSGSSYRLAHFFAASTAHMPVLLAVAAAFYFTADTMLVSGVLALLQKKSLFDVWQQCYLWSFPYYLAGAAIAALMVSTNRSAGWAKSLEVQPLMCLIYVFYRMCVERLTRPAEIA